MSPSFLLTHFLPALQRAARKMIVQLLSRLLFIPSFVKQTFLCLLGHVTGNDEL